jgi:hypothetical protein
MNDLTERELKNRWLTNELLSYCGPIFVAPSLNSYPEQMIDNGTCALVDTGQRRVLVTCCHVLDEYEKQHDANQETILAMALGEGYSCISFKNPKRHLLDADQDLDLAVLEFDPKDINIPHTKNWFKVSEWPIPNVTNGEHIVFVGFPGAWRTAKGIEYGCGCAAIPLVVTDTNARTIACFRDSTNEQVLNDMKDCLGGISGSPAYRLTDRGDFRLVGFAKAGPEKSGSSARKYHAQAGSPLPAVLFTHASFVQRDGTLKRNSFAPAA